MCLTPHARLLPLRKMASRPSSLLILALPGPSPGTVYQKQSTPLKVMSDVTLCLFLSSLCSFFLCFCVPKTPLVSALLARLFIPFKILFFSPFHIHPNFLLTLVIIPPHNYLHNPSSSPNPACLFFYPVSLECSEWKRGTSRNCSCISAWILTLLFCFGEFFFFFYLTTEALQRCIQN